MSLSKPHYLIYIEPLTDHTHISLAEQEQAEALAQFLSTPNLYPSHPSSPSTYLKPSAEPISELPKPELVFSSPFYRCVQTAAPTARELGLEVRLEHGVQEWSVPVFLTLVWIIR